MGGMTIPTMAGSVVAGFAKGGGRMGGVTIPKAAGPGFARGAAAWEA